MNDPAPATTPTAAPRLKRLLEWLHRYRFALAPASFGLGLASFLLIERREQLAQWVGGLLILGWLLIVAEDAWARRLRLSPALLRFGVQAIQQETFFFTLPFFLHTTTWSTGQAGFTIAACIAGACSMWDPLYYGVIVKRPWLYLLFHAFAVFVGTLTVAPILVHLTTTQTLALASSAIALLSLPSLWHLIDRGSALQRVLLVAGAVALGGLAWSLKPWVPPATLWIESALITDRVDPKLRTPGVVLQSVSPAHLHAHGLTAYTAIHAPRGLREMVWHRWLQDGREVDRISLDIVGGRAEGYRAWSYKRGFPQDPRGHWRIEVITDGGQLIGEFEFDVVGEAVSPLPPQVAPPGAPEPPAPTPEGPIPDAPSLEPPSPGDTPAQPESPPESAEPPALEEPAAPPPAEDTRT